MKKRTKSMDEQKLIEMANQAIENTVSNTVSDCTLSNET
jgi:hypothetical protein